MNPFKVQCSKFKVEEPDLDVYSDDRQHPGVSRSIENSKFKIDGEILTLNLEPGTLNEFNVVACGGRSF